MVGRFILLGSLILSVAGCGSSSPTANTGTGGLAVKLVWSAAGSSSSGKTAAKTLLLAPAGVATVRVIVSGDDMTKMQKDFPAAAGSGVVDGIPVGPGRTVKVQGLDLNGLAMFQGVQGGIEIQTGVTDAVSIAMIEIVTATPPGGSGNYLAPLFVNLSASTARGSTVIYYTTNGQDPIGTPSSTEKFGRPPIRNILISGSHTILKYFANFGTSVDNTPIKSEVYDIP